MSSSWDLDSLYCTHQLGNTGGYREKSVETALFQGPVAVIIHILVAVEVWRCKSPTDLAVTSNRYLTMSQGVVVVQHYE